MIRLIIEGGVVMVPLMACSVLALAVIIERLWKLRRGRVIAPDVVIQVNHWVGQGVVEEAKTLCRRVSTPMTNIVMAGLVSSQSPRPDVRRAMEDAGRHETVYLGRNLNWLGVCATLSPLIGLFGTVSGMIKVFRVVSIEGSGNPSVLSAGISEALVTTAAGLLIAIPSLLFHYYFSGKIEDLSHEMERNALAVVKLLEEKVGGHKDMAS